MILRWAMLVSMLLAPAAARAEWHEASTAHFVVYADDKPAAIAKFADELEKFDRIMQNFYPQARKAAAGPTGRVTIFVLASEGAMKRLTGTWSIGGFYIPRAGRSVAFVPPITTRTEELAMSGAVLLRHEYAHHFIYSSFPAVFPIWFSEGIAEFWSTARFEPDGKAVVGVVPQHRAFGLLTGNPLPVEQLVTLTSTAKLNDNQREAIYGRGWLLTHYLMSNRERHKQLANYFTALNRGETPAQAAQAFGDLKVLGRELDRYLTRRQLPAAVIEPGAFVTPPVKLRKLTPGEAATMAVRIQSQRGVNQATAPKVLMEARKAAAPYPDDPGAQTVLAEAEYDARNYALAEAAANRALAAAPAMSDALVYRAMAKLALAQQSKGESWRAVRDAIIDANRADPEDPRPLILYYQSFAAAGEAPTKSAKAGYAKAFDIAQFDMGLRMGAAEMFLKDGNRGEAREALRLIGFHPHGGARAELARSMIAAIDRGDAVDKVLAIQAQADAGTKADADDE